MKNRKKVLILTIRSDHLGAWLSGCGYRVVTWLKEKIKKKVGGGGGGCLPMGQSSVMVLNIGSDKNVMCYNYLYHLSNVYFSRNRCDRAFINKYLFKGLSL